MQDRWDVIVIGGGFYGCMIATTWARKGARVLVIEKEAQAFSASSFVNQARIHNGYHYPRSVLTAQRSQHYYKRFCEQFPEVVDDSFVQHYAIARHHSKVNANQFELFCHHIGAVCEKASPEVRALMNEQMIEEVFRVEETAFNAERLRDRCLKDAQAAGVEFLYNSEVEKVEQAEDSTVKVTLVGGKTFIGKQVWNVAYAGILPLLKRSSLPLLPFRFEWTEVMLIEMPEELQAVGVTVMDGPFFSVMPFPSRGLHSLTHVRYTPHVQWSEEADSVPQKPTGSNAPFALADAARYMPALTRATLRDSLFTVKTILQLNDQDDGRPILFRENHGLQNFHVVMGGKIDTVFDIVDEIESKNL